jgi:hypothetical protein
MECLSDLLVKFLRSAKDQSRVFTLAYIFAESVETKWQLKDEFPTLLLDLETLSQVLDVASPPEAAEVLNRVCHRLPVEMFCSYFFTALAKANDDEKIIWRLCGAASDFLRGHRGAFQIPREYTLRLLRSTYPDRRVIGLKACRYGDFDELEQLQHIVRALQSDIELDTCIGVYQLGVWVDDWPDCKPPRELAAAARAALARIAQIQEPEPRRCALAIINMIEHYSMLPLAVAGE